MRRVLSSPDNLFLEAMIMENSKPRKNARVSKLYRFTKCGASDGSSLEGVGCCHHHVYLLTFILPSRFVGRISQAEK